MDYRFYHWNYEAKQLNEIRNMKYVIAVPKNI